MFVVFDGYDHQYAINEGEPQQREISSALETQINSAW